MVNYDVVYLLLRSGGCVRFFAKVSATEPR
jgi:hypothetical protein